MPYRSLQLNPNLENRFDIRSILNPRNHKNCQIIAKDFPTLDPENERRTKTYSYLFLDTSCDKYYLFDKSTGKIKEYLGKRNIRHIQN